MGELTASNVEEVMTTAEGDQQEGKVDERTGLSTEHDDNEQDEVVRVVKEDRRWILTPGESRVERL